MLATSQESSGRSRKCSPDEPACITEVASTRPNPKDTNECYPLTKTDLTP